MNFTNKSYLRIGSLVSSGFDITNPGYELSNCNMSVSQGIDSKGQVQNDTKAGPISISMNEVPTMELLDWGLKSRRYKDAVILLCDDSGMPIQKTLLQNTACTRMKINYNRSGKGYTSASYTLVSEKLVFADELEISNRWVNQVKHYTTYDTEESSLKDKLPYVDSHISVELTVDGETYEVETFEASFTQEVDHKNQPQSSSRGGQLNIGLNQIVSDKIRAWAIKNELFKDGEISFKITSGSAPLRIKFLHAACVSLTQDISASGGTTTNIILSPAQLFLNDIEHENYEV